MNPAVISLGCPTVQNCVEACPKVTKNLDNQKYDDVKQFCLPSADTNGKSMKELIDEEICPPYIIGKSMNAYMFLQKKLSCSFRWLIYLNFLYIFREHIAFRKMFPKQRSFQKRWRGWRPPNQRSRKGNKKIEYISQFWSFCWKSIWYPPKNLVANCSWLNYCNYFGLAMGKYWGH